MKTIIDYGQAVGALRLSEGWVDLIGKPGHDRNGHTNGKVVHANVKPIIFWQAVPGAKNYHDCPDTLRRYIEEVVLEQMPDIVRGALERQKADLKKLAAEAVNDCRRIISEAEAA